MARAPGEGVDAAPGGDGPEKPRPMARARSLHELRAAVKAKDKFFAAGKPEAEAIAFLAKEYGTDDRSARTFVRWVKGLPEDEDSKEPAQPKTALETWHRAGDLATATEPLLPDDASAQARGAKGRGRKKP